MSEGVFECTKKITEPCSLHPMDCPNCVNGAVCGMRAIMEARPDIIKRCRFFRKKS